MVVLCLPTALKSADSLVVNISEGVDRLAPNEIMGSHYILFDPEGQYAFEQVQQLRITSWDTYEPRYLEGEEFYLWTKTHYRNTGNRPRYDYLVFSDFSESAWAYVVRDGKTEPVLAGSDIRALPGLNASIPLFLAPGETVTVYYRANFSGKRWSWVLYKTTLVNADKAVYRRAGDFGSVYLYLGILFALLIFSVLLYYAFRGRSVLYFALFLAGFGGYFYDLYNITGLLSAYGSLLGNSKMSPFVPLILIGLGGFIYHYLELSIRYPKTAVFYLVTIVLSAGFSLGNILLRSTEDYMMQTGNLFILLLAILTIVLTALAARKGGRPELILLLSFGIVFLVCVVYVLDISFGLLNFNLREGFMWSSLAVAAVIFYGIYDKLTAGIRENQRLNDQHQFRTRFFANITHEFRTPLTLILGPIKQLLQRSDDPADRKLLAIADRNAQRQLHLVNQILDLSRTEASRAILEAAPTDLVPLLRRITHTYDSLARQREIRLDFVSELSSLIVYAEAAKLETVLYNLLSNAFKFTPTDGSIIVSLSAARETAEISVRDTGHGIPAAKLPFVFNRFYTDDTNVEEPIDATGIGLALSRELVLLHGGTIDVISVPGVQTEFRVGLPYTPGLREPEGPHFTEEKIEFVDADLIPTPVTAEQGETLGPHKAPLILVVEDNADMRTYISMGLEGEYRVRTAPNGRAGLELAHQLMPDLIISDVMMPEMNGFELCLDLKTDIATSHIPVILLTARSASRDRLHGLDTGADDYLLKPFETKELLARARNLIKSRKALRERFSNSIALKPTEVTATPVDQQFLTAALRVIEDNIGNEAFGIDQLALEMTMSRTSLNRKFRALIDQSSNQFIRGIRLERAADLLLKTDDTVAIIAGETGFGSATYFIKSFREKFGMTPGAFRKKKEEVG